MNVVFQRRNFDADLLSGDLDYQVERYSHAAMGGPKQAVINVKGNDIDLWNLTEKIRCPVTVYSAKGDAVWWGYVAQVEATAVDAAAIFGYALERNRVHVGVSIDNMYNSVAVAYALVDLSDGTKSRDTTAYFFDDFSISEYGTRQLLWSPGAASAAHAEAAGTAKLQQVANPDPVITPSDRTTESGAVLTCRGWWDTMEWRYFANDGTATVDTGTQAGTIITARGQFFAAVDTDNTSGIILSEKRDGDNTALYYVTQMLETGTTNYRRLLVRVDENRRVRVYEEPALDSLTYSLLSDGNFLDPFDSPIRKETCPVAFWARTKDAVSTGVNANTLNDPSLQFIEEMEYIVAEDKLVHRARGDLDPWEFPVVRDG